MRQIVAILLAWLAGSLAADAVVFAHSGVRAATEMLPLFMHLIGFWLLVVGVPLGALRQRFRPLVASDLYLFALASAFVAFVLFFVLFMHVFMFSLPVAAFASAATFSRLGLRRVAL